jgi:hypothetical protein
MLPRTPIWGRIGASAGPRAGFRGGRRHVIANRSIPIWHGRRRVSRGLFIARVDDLPLVGGAGRGVIRRRL